MLAVSNLLQFVIQKNIPLSTVRILHEMSTNISYRKIPVISPGLIHFIRGFAWACMRGAYKWYEKTFRNKLMKPTSSSIKIRFMFLGTRKHKAQVRKQIREARRSLYETSSQWPEIPAAEVHKVKEGLYPGGTHNWDFTVCVIYT